jgi:hypothetical protein
VAPLLAAGVVLTFSRGALLSVAVGVAVLLLARPRRGQAESAVLLVGLGALTGALAAALPAVTDFRGSDGARAAQGAGLAVALLLAGAVAAAAQSRLSRRNAEVALGRAIRRAIAGAGVAAVVLALVLIATGERGSHTGTPQFGATASRLSSVQSNRYAYWRVAVRTWADHPLIGDGASGFAVEWLRRRTIPESARDAHSLPLETLAELGLAGFLALLVAVGGVAVAARAGGVGWAGAAGGLAAWGAHAAIDWAWEMPADTLFALLLAAAVIAAAERHPAAT